MRSLRILFILTLTAAFTITIFGQSSGVTALKMPSGSDTITVEGNLDTGKIIPLAWAEKSTVACFPGTRFAMFDGNHVFYRITLPARSRMTVTLEPKDEKLINLYALRQGASENAVPPAIETARSCEASYPLYANKEDGQIAGERTSGNRKVEYISAGAPFSILIGVAGADKLAEGQFTLEVKITNR